MHARPDTVAPVALLPTVLILGLLASFGPLAIDMYLPALPAIGHDLGVGPGQVQLTLSAFFIGFAGGQLVYGPVSDRWGRRPALVGGIVLFVATSALCAISPSIEWLTAFRLLNALGGGAGVVVARAVVRDRFSTDHAARVLSFVMLVTGLAPLLAPLIGGQVLLWLGWRAIFWLLAGFGAVALLAVLTWLPESRPKRPTTAAPLAADVARIAADPRALAGIMAGGAAFAGMFAYISGTPFVYIELFAVSPQAYGVLFAINVIGIMAGAVVNVRLVLHHGARRMIAIAATTAALAALALLLAAITGAGGLAGIVVPLFVYMSTLNVISANALSLAAEAHAARAGSVAALFGATQFALGAVAGLAVGQLHDGTPVPMAAVIAACGLLCLLAQRIAVRRPPDR